MRRLWRVAMAVWVVPSLLAVPMSLALGAAVELDVGGPPAAETEVVLRAVLEHGPWLLTVLALVSLTTWAWSVLWHAGVAGWARSGHAGRARLGHVLGHGVTLWWRQAVMVWCGFGLSVLIIAAPAAVLVLSAEHALSTGNERALQLLAVVGFVVVLTVVVGSIAAASRATWVVPVVPASRLPLLWWQALVAAVRQLPTTVVAVAVWSAPALIVTVLLVTSAWMRPELVTGAAVAVLEQLAALVRACCAVGLLGSFAPAEPSTAGV